MMRKEYIQELAITLIKPFVQERMLLGTLRTSLKLLINSTFDIEMPNTVQYDPIDCKLAKRKRCVHCNIDRKTQYICCTCKRPRCEEHRSWHCKILF